MTRRRRPPKPPKDHKTKDLFGTPPHKLTRRSDPDTSKRVGDHVDTAKGERQQYLLVVAAGARGIINTEAADILGMPPHWTSPRWSGLIDKGFIVDSGHRRKNRDGNLERICVLPEFYVDPDDETDPDDPQGPPPKPNPAAATHERKLH